MQETDGEGFPLVGRARPRAALALAAVAALLVVAVVQLGVASAGVAAAQASRALLLGMAGPPAALPAAFSLPPRVAGRSQGGRATGWDFAATRLVEAQYREQGERLGLLAAGEYVRFSEQAYGRALIELCSLRPEDCPDTPQAGGSAEDGYAGWLFQFQDRLGGKLAADMPSCQYTPRPGSDARCGGLDEFLASSGVRYTVEGYGVFYTPEQIRRALVEGRRHLLLTVELYGRVHYVPCDDALGYSATAECTTRATPCPAELQGDGSARSCVALRRLSSVDGRFGGIGDPARAEHAGAHVMLVAGYNERGLLLLNSWGPQLSHSLRYLAGEISAGDDAFLCPNQQDPRNWVPIAPGPGSLYKLRGTTLLRFVAGGFQPGHVAPPGGSAADALSAAFDESLYYAVDRVEAAVDGTVRIVFGAEQSLSRALGGDFGARVRSPPLPLELFQFFFEPQGISDRERSSDDECGFYEMEYGYIDAVRARGGAFFAEDIPLRFGEASFRDTMRDGPASDALGRATRTWQQLAFRGPTPWQDDDAWRPRWQ